MTKKKKILLSIVAVVLALAAYGYFFGVQTFWVISARMMRQPLQDVVPKPLKLEPCSEPVTALKAFDYSFSVPWSDCSQRADITSLVVWACSESNFHVVCFSPSVGVYSALLPEPSSEDAEYRQAMIEFMGLRNIVYTNFHICKKVWEVTPEDISLFDSKREAMSKSFLLVLKTIGFPPEIRESYFFEHADIKGFQFGSPSIDSTVQLSIFDQMDRELRLIVSAFTNSPVPLTQADINTIITTFSSNP